MEQLSDFRILDFCEWIKNSVLDKAQYSDINMWDLLFNENYNDLLMRKAKEYCDTEKNKNLYSNDNMKKFLNEIIKIYCESNEFQDLCYRIKWYIGDNPQRYLIGAFSESFESFLDDLKDKMSGFFEENCYYNRQYINSYVLIDNLRCYYKDSLEKDRERNPFLKLIVEDNAIEIEFLKWIEQKNIGKEVVEKIDLMPVDIFEKYAHRFCKDTGNGAPVKRKLVKIFKRSDQNNLLSKLRELLPYDSAYRKRNFRYVSQRYLNDKAIYKCMILPIKADYDKFRKLVTDRWKDLNDISADYLDIYYCFVNYGESGYDLIKQLHYLPEKFRAKLPCIVLWKEKMNEAMCISINELSVEDVYYMIAGPSGIVDLIIEGKSTDEIVKGVNSMGEERRNKERPLNKYIQNANGATHVQQNMVVDSTGVTISGEFLMENTDAFVTEIAKAISLVESSELNEQQKKEVKSILEEAKEGVRERSEEKTLSSKKRFLTFLAFAGNLAPKLIAALAGLTTIAKFFNLG